MNPKRALGFFVVAFWSGMLTYGQHVPKLSLVEKNASLEKVLKDIQHLSGFTYLMNPSDVAYVKPMSFIFKNVPLTTILDSALGDAPLFYQLIGRTIHIRPGSFVRGRVVDSLGLSLLGATISGPDPQFPVFTTADAQGYFRLRLPQPHMTIYISCVGYEPRSFSIAGTANLLVRLTAKPDELYHALVSTGFHDTPKDRSPGSFDQLNTALIERRTATNILDHLDGVTSGLLTNTNVLPGTNQSSITIRGRSTIFSNPNPLIVVDNFPYSGDANNINPEDIASVSVLKDAAAASIWGTRAANGVIVMTTKQSKYGQHPRLFFTTSLTAGQKPNLHYTPILSSADYVSVEESLFRQGFYDNSIASLFHPALSPVVEYLLQQRLGLVSAADTATQLNFFRRQDTRRDLYRYWYQPLLNQQYWLGFAGGTATNHYFLSAGLDRNLASLTRNAYDRITVYAGNAYQLLPQLELNTALNFTSSTTDNNNTGGVGAPYPYLNLAGPGGNALAIPYQLRLGYADSAGGGRLLPWHYKPLDELRNANNTTRLTDWRLNFGLHYNFLHGFQLQALYQYGQGSSDQQNLQSLLTYYTRNLLNEFTQINPITGQLSDPIPMGDILDETLNNYLSHNARLQLNYDHNFGGDHEVHLLTGAELQDDQNTLRIRRLYGYNANAQSSLPVASYTTLYPQYSQPGFTATIPYPDNTTSTYDHYWSYYFNGSYQYLQRLTVSASARVDQSNLFGVDINRKTLPLWSAGLAWELSRQDFYHLDSWLPLLRLRLTDGYNGNVYKNVSGYATVYASPGISTTAINLYGTPAVAITNPPNPDLRWEQIHILNTGLDFATHHNHLEGSLDYYTKNGRYLIGQASLDPTSGNTQYTANVANMTAHGIDLTLRTQTDLGPVHYSTELLFNFARDKVTRYLVKPGTIQTVLNPAFINPLAGHPLYSIYALRWAGLDPKTGDPMGWLNGHPSENYGAITQSPDFSTLLYKGPANPPYFGSWRHTFTYKQWGLSLLFVYKFGDYFTRPSIQYYTLFTGASTGHPDFDRRWQQPGDEQHTYVPSMIYPANVSRDFFYASSEVLVQKGDLFRWQDLQLYYDLPKKAIPRLQSLRIYGYVNHLALLWTANHQHIDPDAQTSLPPVRTFTLGIKMGL